MSTNISNQFRSRVFLSALTGALIAGGAAVAISEETSKTAEHPTLKLPVEESAVDRDTLPRGSYAPVVKKVAPAVVRIETTTTIKSPARRISPGLE